MGPSVGPFDRLGQPVSDPIQDSVGLVLGFVFMHAGCTGPNLMDRWLNGLCLQLYIYRGLARSERTMGGYILQTGSYEPILGLLLDMGLNIRTNI